VAVKQASRSEERPARRDSPAVENVRSLGLSRSPTSGKSVNAQVRAFLTRYAGVPPIVRSFVETNVLVHAVDEADARRRDIARGLLAAGAGGRFVVRDPFR
jgi:hypothetical protein